MTKKKPLTEGTVRHIRKGTDKPSKKPNVRPVKPPPKPKK